MKRNFTSYLEQWKGKNYRKPLMLRGARQVGKTYIIRDFGDNYFSNHIEINFDEKPEYSSIFDTNDIQTIILSIEALSGQKIIPSDTLLFFDEIQSCPKAIHSLRYFYEKLPELHIICAGSLLDFTLNNFPYSMPVGRIEFAYLYPMNFQEFLLALNEESLVKYMIAFSLESAIPEAIHQKLLNYLRLYFSVGGMPQAVDVYRKNQNLSDVSVIHESIIRSFEFDFSKYGSQKQQQIMTRLIKYIPRTAGQKFKYANFDNSLRSAEIKNAINLLEMSRIIHLVQNTKASTPPLETGTNNKVFKIIFLDIGLTNHILNLNFVDLRNYILNNEGSISEQFIGQELLQNGQSYYDGALYYWMREKAGTGSEIDYVTTLNNNILPIEVKAGKTGRLKSLHVFMALKKPSTAIRFNTDTPSVFLMDTKLNLDKEIKEVRFKLISLPLYLVGEMKRLVLS